ncbi:haloacid dehalogenase-like hydrolase [Coniochaeta sp. 2T2.1]|nr:haloacid dehalogenase-like hydrolase [Coniochaeta sp. 2T2.1]
MSEEHPVEYILDTINDIMASSPQPKVLLFDIGGVCVVSPFQSILDYEIAHSIPPGWINYSISRTAPNGFWHKLETGQIPMDKHYFAGFNADLHDEGRWKAFYTAQQAKNPSLPKEIPPLPKIDGEFLFFDMMAASQAPDPWMYPALKKLKADGRFILAALSNTVIFPPEHPYSQKEFLDDPVRSLFDVFVSSAHVGLRKPDPSIYEMALEKVDEYARKNADTVRGRQNGWGNGVKADEVLFLDDIGENLKAGKKAGFRTFKVSLGRAYEAVEELERVTGLKLEGGHPKVPVELKAKPKAKI